MRRVRRSEQLSRGYRLIPGSLIEYNRSRMRSRYYVLLPGMPTFLSVQTPSLCSFRSSGLLIDFGLAEPAEKWMHRSQALAQHRDTKANKRNRSATLTGTDTISERVGQKACRRRSDSGATGESTENVVTNTPKNDRGSVSRIDRVKQENNGETFIEAKRKGEPKGDRAAKVLRKVERGGTTGFRAPEVLWHSRDQVMGHAHFRVC